MSLGANTAVKVKTESHPRFGTAGIVHKSDPAVPDQVDVKFDIDLVVETVDVADLLVLS